VTAAEERVVAVLRAHAPDVLAYLQRRVGVDDAPDLLSEVMTIVWRRAAHLPVDDEPARMWVFGVARGVLRNNERGARRRTTLVERLRSHLRDATPSDPHEHDDVRDAIAELSTEQAEIVTLIHWEGMGVGEAATILGIPASTARSRYHRARAALRIALLDRVEPR
jgi:RNA polymerase sigma factor (sigma-70 family)